MLAIVKLDPSASSGGRLFALLLGGMMTSAALAQEGIFAEFNTSMGSYTCRLEYVTAPKACANFIGLATGDRPWLDLTTGQVRTDPFYDGTTYHRVIAGFMNQGGSPNGQGTDGPGYSFVDEFDSNLLHDQFGDLSMANSGPDSNGSQFFTTATNAFWLDFKHTVFGRLAGGSNVVYAINHVATDANDKPLTNVVLDHVVIRRVGAAAQAFDIHDQGLPAVNPLETSIQWSGANLLLGFTNSLGMDNRLFSTSDLEGWNGFKIGIETAPPITSGLLVNPVAPQRFFRMAQIDYPDALYVPETVVNRTVALTFSPGSTNYGTVVILATTATGGLYQQNGGVVGSFNYTWVQDAYRGRFLPVVYSALDPMELHLDFDSVTNGTFKGTAYPPGTSATVSGVFASTP